MGVRVLVIGLKSPKFEAKTEAFKIKEPQIKRREDATC